jgi:hypothetical protein
MAEYDCVLVSPTPEGLAAALAAAASSANQQALGLLLDWPPPGLDEVLARATTEPEGRHQWNGGEDRPRSGDRRSVVALTWWVDRLGRRHHRVFGGNAQFTAGARLNVLCPGEGRPPLWLTYPEHLYLRQGEDKAGYLVAVCPCGAAGRPEDLAWMGPYCGPCHDRREAGEPLPEERLTILAGHEGGVARIVFSPDGRRLLTRSEGGGAYLWEVRTGKFEWLGAGAWSLAFSPDGRVAAVGSQNGEVGLWEVERRARSSALQARAPIVMGLAFAPDGRSLAVGASHAPAPERTEIALWDLQKRERLPFPPGPGTQARCLVFSPDGSLLAGAVNDESVVVWEMPSGRVRATFREEQPKWYVPSLAFSPDGRTVAAADGHGRLHLLDVAGGRCRATLRGRGAPLGQVAFAPDGSVVATAVSSGAVFFADPVKGEGLGSYRWHGDGLEALAFSPDGEWLATGGGDGLIKLWPWRALLRA